MLSLITGIDPRGRREALYDRIEKAGPGAVLLVPEQFSFESERLLTERFGQGDGGAEVFSFSRLANSIFREYGGLAGDCVDPAARMMLMSAALSEAGDALSFYTKKSHGAAFVEKLVAADAELSTAGAGPEELLRVAREAPEGVLRSKAEDLGKVFLIYRALLEKGFIDPLEDVARAVELLHEHDFFAGRAVFVDGFTGFTGCEIKMLEMILEQAPSVTVTLCCDPLRDGSGEGLFSKTEKTASRLEAMAKRAGVKVAAPLRVSGGDYWESPMLGHLAESFLRPGAEHYDGDGGGGLELWSADDPYDEARWVASRCRELAEKGMRWRDMAVIARDLTLYEHALPDAFAKAGIPLFMDRREDISSRPLAAYLNSALEAARTNLEPAPVFRMLKTGVQSIPPEDVAALENYCFVWSIRGALWASPFVGNPSGFGARTEQDELELARVEALRQRVAPPLLRLRARLSGTDGEGFAAALWDFIEETETAPGLQRLCALYEQAGDSRAARELEELWNCAVSALDRFSATLSGVRLSAEDMARLFALALSSADIGSLPRTLDAVAAGSADRMRPFEPRAVFVIGVSEGTFPQPPASGALFTDPDRQQMARLGVELADTADDQLRAERLFAYTAFTAPRERLFVSFSRSAVGGAENRASLLMESCAALFPALEIKETGSLPPEFFLRSSATAFELLASAEGPAPFTEALRRELLSDPVWGPKAKLLGQRVSPEDFRMEDARAAEQLFGRDMRISPSNAENYYTCAFSYFANKGLRLRERRAAQLDPMENGDLIHDVLYEVVQKHGVRELGSLPEHQLAAEVDAVLEARIEEATGSPTPPTRRFGYLLGRLSGFLQKLVKRLATEFEKSAFEPVAFELPVDEDCEVEPLRLVTPEGRSVLVRGRIDRVDMLEKGGKKYVRVVDYKSGSKSFALSDVFYGLNLQMLIYLFAIWQGGAGRFAGNLPAGVLYMPAKDSVLTAPRDIPPEDAAELRAEAFRMNGLLLDDPDVLTAMEPGLEGIFIPVKARKDGGYSTQSLATAQQFGAIKDKVEKLLCSMADELIKGNVGALPLQAGDSPPCSRCRFAPVCRRAAGSRTRSAARMKKEEFYEAIKEDAAHARSELES